MEQLIKQELADDAVDWHWSCSRDSKYSMNGINPSTERALSCFKDIPDQCYQPHIRMLTCSRQLELRGNNRSMIDRIGCISAS